MDMNLDYDWRFRLPGPAMNAHVILKEKGDRLFVSGDRLHAETEHAQLFRFFDRVKQKPLTDPLAAVSRRNDNRLDFRLLSLHDQGDYSQVLITDG
jgi:hypothetical protein